MGHAAFSDFRTPDEYFAVTIGAANPDTAFADTREQRITIAVAEEGAAFSGVLEYFPGLCILVREGELADHDERQHGEH